MEGRFPEKVASQQDAMYDTYDTEIDTKIFPGSFVRN